MSARFGIWAAIAILGWGVLALGATRPWGYIPLLAGMAIYGAASVLTGSRPTGVSRGLYASYVVLCAAVFLQVIPLPETLVANISPAGRIVGKGATATSRSMSIDPRATTLGLTFVLALGLFFAGIVRTLERHGVARMAPGIIGLGALVAMVGIAEVSTSWAGVYAAAGLPLPPDSTPHGPFASRNHYAAWMLMSFAVAFAYVCAVLDQPIRQTIGRLLLLQGAALLMAVALVETRSRAGILGLMFAVAALCGELLRRSTTRMKRLLVVSVAVLLLVAAFAATGLQPIANRFVTQTWSTAHGRLPIWRQAAAIAQDFRFAGSGLNTYRRIVAFYPAAEVDQSYEGAHNDFLQLAIEGGLLVGLPAIAALSFFVMDASRRIHESARDHVTAWLRIGGAVGLLLVAAQEIVDFSLQIPGNAALFVVLAAVAVHHAPGQEPPNDATFVGVGEKRA